MMRAQSIASEAWRNFGTGTSRAVTAFLVFGFLASFGAVLAAYQVVNWSRQVLEYQVKGGATLIITKDNGIDGARCAALGSIKGVKSAGALRQSTDVTPAAMPSRVVTAVEVTSTFSDVLRQTAGLNTNARITNRGGVWVSSDLANDLGIVIDPSDKRSATANHKGLNAGTGQVFAQRDGVTAPVAGVFASNTDGRIGMLNYAVIQPTPSSGRFSQCWVTIWPPTADAGQLLNYTVINEATTGAQKAEPARITRLNATLGDGIALSQTGVNKVSYLLRAMSFAIALVLGFVFVHMRRLEFSSALHAGVRRRDLGLILLVESGLWLVPSVLLAILLSTAVALLNNPDPPWAAMFAGTQVGAVTLLGAWIGMFVAFHLVKESQILNYFKSR